MFTCYCTAGYECAEYINGYLLLYDRIFMYRLYIMFTCYCTAGYLCTEYILCLLVIVLQDMMNVQNIYYVYLLLYGRIFMYIIYIMFTCYCTAGYEYTE